MKTSKGFRLLILGIIVAPPWFWGRIFRRVHHIRRVSDLVHALLVWKTSLLWSRRITDLWHCVPFSLHLSYIIVPIYTVWNVQNVFLRIIKRDQGCSCFPGLYTTIRCLLAVRVIFRVILAWKTGAFYYVPASCPYTHKPRKNRVNTGFPSIYAVFKKWSWGESNPCPKINSLFFYYHSLLFNIPSAAREKTLWRF